MECRTGSHDQLTTLRWKLMTMVMKGKKVNWTLFIFNRLVEEVIKESTRNGYGLVLNFLIKRCEINLGNDGSNITKNK